MITTKATISYKNQIVPPLVNAVQGDTGRNILFTISDYEIPAGATATFYIQKPSKEAVYNTAVIDASNNTVEIELTAQCLAEYGENFGQIRIMLDGEVITSFDFILLVKTFRGIDAIESTSETNIFDQAVEAAAGQFQTEAEAIVDEVIESIPEDYSALSQDVTDLKADLSDLFDYNNWIEVNDEYFNTLTKINQHRLLLCIPKLEVIAYGANASARIYNVQITNDSELRFSFKFVTPENTTKSLSIVLPASETYVTKTLDSSDYLALSFCTINITYKTSIGYTGTIVGASKEITINVTEAPSNGLTKAYPTLDSRLIQKVVCSKDVLSITVNRIRNYGSSGYIYYAVYTVVREGNQSKTYTKSNQALLSGIYTEELDDVLITFDADMLNQYANRLESTPFNIDVLYADKTNNPEKTYHYKSDMLYDKTSLPPFNVYTDSSNTPDNTKFGYDNVRYVLDLPKYTKLHYTFDFQFTEPIPYKSTTSESVYASLTKLSSGQLAIAEWAYATYGGKNLYERDCYVGIATPTVNRERIVGRKYKNNIGQSAFSVKTTLDPSIEANHDIVMRFEKSNHLLKFYHTVTGTVIGQVTFTDNDTVDSLISAINQTDGITCESLESSGHTCSELFFIGNGSLPLVSYYDTPNKYDNHTIYVPYALNREWHNVEVIIDESNSKAYAAIDGLTFEADLGTLSDTQTLEIGGTVTGQTSTITPIRIRNLEIDIDSFGDAEIVTSITYPYNGRPQLISGINPRLIIFEGHGVDVGSDADGVVSDDMAVKTDRLRVVFDYLQQKGYKAVNWQDVIKWKENNVKIPKRSFCMMFDDWRFENYINYKKRQPFTQYNVNAGLAVITDEKTRDDTVVINGTEYSVADVVDAVMNNEWYPCSHTKDHRRITNFTPSELDELFEDDCLSADMLGIYSNVLVYPYGALDNYTAIPIEHSGFTLGVSITEDSYNCKANSNYYLSRTEIGIRVTLENVLSAIV